MQVSAKLALACKPRTRQSPRAASAAAHLPRSAPFSMALPTTMTRVVVTAFNAKDPAASLAVETVPVPTFGPSDVLVRVVARPVNPSDVASLMGFYAGFTPKAFPAVPGLEGAGVVVAAGADSGVAVGTRAAVLFHDAQSGHGSWAEYAVVPASSLVPMPPSVSLVTASQLVVNPVTTVGMLDTLAPPPGAYVLQSAGGSTLGRLLVQAAAKRGVKVISVVRREAQKAELLASGHAAVIVESEDIAARVREITGGALAWGATDCVAGDMTARLASAVRDGGQVLVYGAMGSMTASAGVGDLLFRGVTVRGFYLTAWLKAVPHERRTEVFSTVVAWLADGSLTPHTGELVPLAEAARAVTLSESSTRDGKVILTSPES